MTAPEHSKPVRLAGAAFLAALDGRQQKAADLVKRISDECGGEGLCTALMAWIDTYADHATDGQPGRARPQMAYINESTGELDDEKSDRLPEEIRWAGQLIAARAAMDQPKFRSLIDVMPTDGKEIGDYVMAVLLTIARTINGLPRGFGRMGRPA